LFYSVRVSDEQGRGLDEGGAADEGRAAGEGGVADEVARETLPAAAARDADDPARGRRRTLAFVLALFCAGAVAGLVYLGRGGNLRGRISEQAGRVRDAITGADARPPDPYAEAVLKVEEDRGEAVGRKADAEVPAELKQYAEARRFLAVQATSAREAGLSPSHDFAELAASIRDGGLVEAPRLGRGYVLYGVGLAATGALTHYDAARSRSVPLFADEAGLKSYGDGLDAERARLEGELEETAEKLKALGRKDKQARAQLNEEAKAKRKELAGVEDGLKSLKLYYGTPKDRGALFAEYETLASLARDFGGRTYDLNDAASAREFQARLLTYVRPAALAVMEELGSAYQEKFGRPLPITSLIRTEEYQRTLREAGNPNAGNFPVEPHTTGLAFDVYYHFMSGAEQQFVMDEIARLERDGRVEALRELRDHYHVYAFPEGKRPDDKAVDKTLKGGARASADSKEKTTADSKEKRAADSKEKKPAGSKEKKSARPAKEPKGKASARQKKDSSARAPARVKKEPRRRR
jgi:hypothetical protein